MRELRKPLFILAFILIVLAVLVETGSALLLHASPPSTSFFQSQIGTWFPGTTVSSGLDQLTNQHPPGLGIPYLAILDAILLFTMVLIGASLLIPERVEGRLQGCATFIFGLLVILGGIAMAFAAFNLIILMISLFLSVPFGTIAYLAIYGFFDRNGASIALSLIMFLKLGFSICLVLSQERFLQNIGLVLLILTSLIANVIVSFLQGFPPGFLVSIADAIAALIVAILAIIWAVLLFLGSLSSILKSIPLPR